MKTVIRTVIVLGLLQDIGGPLCRIVHCKQAAVDAFDALADDVTRPGLVGILEAACSTQTPITLEFNETPDALPRIVWPSVATGGAS
jgi:hypothetical protein